MSEQLHQSRGTLSPAEHGSMADYLEEGGLRARSLNNRGPVRFDGQGRLAPDIIEAYERIGFYVFENVIDEAELAELDADLAGLLDRAPAGEGLDARRQHRPDEVPYRYAPCALEEDRQWSVEERKAELRHYAAGTIFV